jgi:hypothetical protein
MFSALLFPALLAGLHLVVAETPSCFGDTSNLPSQQPNWNGDFLWELREDMCHAGGCTTKNPTEPDCLKYISPDVSWNLMLHGNVTGQTDDQFSQSCYDATVSLQFSYHYPKLS